MSRHVVRTGMPGRLSLPWQFVGTGILSRHLRRGGLTNQHGAFAGDGVELDTAY